MISQLLDAEFVRARTADLITLLESHAARMEEAPEEFNPDKLEAEDLKDTASLLREQMNNPEFFRHGEIWMPRDPYLTIVQSTVEEYYRKAGAVAGSQARGFAGDLPEVTGETLKPEWIPTATRGFGREMEQSDLLGWSLSFGVASVIRLAKGKHPFRSRPDDDIPFTMGDHSRLILSADWGSGVARAQAVGRQMAKRLKQAANQDRHVIHLGDVYYAGRSGEYAGRFMPYWPVNPGEASQIGSWNLNANHDMFTGGHGYFGCLDSEERFARQKGFSYFALENSNWLVVGLDTAWEAEGIKGDSGGLQEPQMEWLLRLRARSPEKRLILLSHHQLFSLYENDSPLLQRRMEALLSNGPPIDAWFWGHEHRCAVYEPSHRINYPVLMGHGGVPVHASKKPQPPGVRFEYRGKLKGGLGETFAMMGFVVVDLQGKQATVRFVNEENLEHVTHTI